jgi:hypothetical protein
MLDSSTFYNSRRTYGPRKTLLLYGLEMALFLAGGLAIAATIIGLTGPAATAPDFFFLG